LGIPNENKEHVKKNKIKKENPKVLGIPLIQHIPQTLHQTMVAIINKMG
jgi:hypothetical protein